MRLPWLTVLALLAACAASSPQFEPRPLDNMPASEAREDDPLRGLLEEMARHRVVLLGEPNHHGDEASWLIKAGLVERLVRDHGFDAVLFEAGIFEFLEVEEERAGGVFPIERFEDAMGALWTDAEGARRWTSRIHAAAIEHDAYLGGLDHQPSSTARATRARLPEALSRPLPPARAALCRARFTDYLSWNYTEGEPFEAAASDLMACAEEAEREAEGELLRARAANLSSDLRRVLGEPSRSFDRRDAAMAENLSWHLERLAPDARVVVWCANVHAAKSIPSSVGPELHPLGSLAVERFGDDVFAVGFTSRDGAFTERRKVVRTLEPAPADSVEARVPEDAPRWVPADELREPMPARLLSPSFSTARWSEAFDAVIVAPRQVPARFSVP